MDWININDRYPEKYQEVLIASDDGRVKTAIYMGNGKWSTYLPIVCWAPFPAPPDGLVEIPIEAPKKKRGRPKKEK